MMPEDIVSHFFVTKADNLKIDDIHLRNSKFEKAGVRAEPRVAGINNTTTKNPGMEIPGLD